MTKMLLKNWFVGVVLIFIVCVILTLLGKPVTPTLVFNGAVGWVIGSLTGLGIATWWNSRKL